MKNNNYDEFVEKFKPKKTTDDCYTPENVYIAIAEWVAQKYQIDIKTFTRPFYPGGDYIKHDYSGKVVVDNPPFSILSEIIRFYVDNNIKFFLFVPTLCGPMRYSDFCTVLPIGISITYANGANVCTSFATNLEPSDVRLRTAPDLYSVVNNANKENLAIIKKQLSKYSYPLELATMANLYPYSKYGIEFTIPRDESVRISALDMQKQIKKSIFGGGLLLSERLTAEREKAEREKAEVFELSSREKMIIKEMSAAQEADNG
ncbi:MAG: hypothetical protein ACI4JB_09890 [Porcipelethomonas sp.]